MKKTLLQLSMLLMLTSPASFAIDNLKLNSNLNYASDSLDGALITGQTRSRDLLRVSPITSSSTAKDALTRRGRRGGR